MIYVYDCPTCGDFELHQSIHADALTSCPYCSASIHRVISPSEVIWKGRFRWMKGEPEVDMDKIEAEENKAKVKEIDGKIVAGLEEKGRKHIW